MCKPVVNHSFEHHAGDKAIWFGSTPILRNNALGGGQRPHFSSPSTNLTRGFVARWLFREPPCHKGTIHLQISLPSPVFEPIFNGTSVSVTNHYTGWMALIAY
ncbi:hypothetical protein TNCV_1627041 [Trichonephila clavipes]|nr:hypothetical protein TNCV_1627041 [Trichonephila clavipes]